MLAVSENDLSRLLQGLDHFKCQLLLENLLSALGAFTAQQKALKANPDLISSSSTNSTNTSTTIHQPARTSIVSKQTGTTSLFMPVSDEQSIAFKVVTVPKPTSASASIIAAATAIATATTSTTTDNAPLPAIRGVITLLSPTGQLEGVLSAAEITAFRTALASMIPFSRCSSWIRKRHILIFGSGKQAEWHARLALLTLPDPKQVEKITFVNRSQRRLRESIVEGVLPYLRKRYPHLVIEAYSREEEDKEKVKDKGHDGSDNGGYQARLRADLASADAIFCCTPSTTPLFTYDDLVGDGPSSDRQKPRYISLIGSYKPHMQEVDSRTLLSGANGMIYVDSIEACMEEAGELIRARVDASSQLIELGDISLSGVNLPLLRNQSGEGNVIFKCVGMGIMDLAIARSLLHMAREEGYGTEVNGF